MYLYFLPCPICPSQDTSELFFEDCRVPATALLGEEGKGFAYLMTELPQERLVSSNGVFLRMLMFIDIYYIYINVNNHTHTHTLLIAGS